MHKRFKTLIYPRLFPFIPPPTRPILSQSCLYHSRNSKDEIISTLFALRYPLSCRVPLLTSLPSQTLCMFPQVQRHLLLQRNIKHFYIHSPIHWQ